MRLKQKKKQRSPFNWWSLLVFAQYAFFATISKMPVYFNIVSSFLLSCIFFLVLHNSTVRILFVAVIKASIMYKRVNRAINVKNAKKPFHIVRGLCKNRTFKISYELWLLIMLIFMTSFAHIWQKSGEIIISFIFIFIWSKQFNVMSVIILVIHRFFSLVLHRTYRRRNNDYFLLQEIIWRRNEITHHKNYVNYVSKEVV